MTFGSSLLLALEFALVLASLAKTRLKYIQEKRTEKRLDKLENRLSSKGKAAHVDLCSLENNLRGKEKENKTAWHN